jgi:virginiamycin B lyase
VARPIDRRLRRLSTIAVCLSLAGCGGDRPATSLQAATGTGTAPTATGTASALPTTAAPTSPTRSPAVIGYQEFAVPAGSHPHDVAPAPDGTVWYTAQAAGALGRLDPSTGDTHHVELGAGSSPHGVVVAPDGAAWVTDSGLNAIVRVDATTEEARTLPLPAGAPNVNLNTATFDRHGWLWFTGQGGWYGRVQPEDGTVDAFPAPGGRGPYGIATAPDGTPWYSSLAGSYIARIDPEPAEIAAVLDTPTQGGGARRIWFDSRGRAWVTEWDAGRLAMYDPQADRWQEWPLPGEGPQPYAVFVDERDIVWVSDFGSNAFVRFDPASERFESFPLPTPGANVRQLLGRPGEVWGAESGADKLVVLRTGG